MRRGASRVRAHRAEFGWITPNAESAIIHDARVSSDPDVAKMPDDRLLRYLVKHWHWSPFEMANMKLDIYSTRDIGRQILRHRSFHFQEFSQRYADVAILGEAVMREARMQHPTNRQMSLECDDRNVTEWWAFNSAVSNDVAIQIYNDALANGIAKEVARAILPEGLTPTKMHMNGTIRDWIHFIKVRTHETAQKEVRMVAESARAIFAEKMPVIAAAVFGGDDV